MEKEYKFLIEIIEPDINFRMINKKQKYNFSLCIETIKIIIENEYEKGKKEKDQSIFFYGF